MPYQPRKRTELIRARRRGRMRPFRFWFWLRDIAIGFIVVAIFSWFIVVIGPKL